MFISNKVKKINFGQRVELTVLEEFQSTKNKYEQLTGAKPDTAKSVSNLLKQMTQEMKSAIYKLTAHDAHVTALYYEGYLEMEGFKRTSSGQPLVSLDVFKQQTSKL
jgi:hypothetical protein